MTDAQEWQHENSQRSFPFTEGSRRETPPRLPYGFIVDLKVFPDFKDGDGVYLSEISYDSAGDGSYALEFSRTSSGQAIISGAVGLLDGSASRVGSKVLLENSPGYPDGYTSYCIFTPGPEWGGPGNAPWIQSADGVSEANGVYTMRFSAEEATVDPSVVVPGNKSFRRIFIEGRSGQIPPISEWGSEVTQSLKEGANISLSQSPDDPTTVVISAGGGLGSGYPDDAGEGVVKYINMVSAGRGKGEIKLGAEDCLNKIESPNTIYPDGENAGQITLANTIQLLSDCIPCCGCSKYRAVSAAITRRSAKLKEICDRLSDMVSANAALYNDAVLKINASRKPLVKIRNLRVRETGFTVSVQNACVLPVYAHIGITMTGGSGVEWSRFQLGSLDTQLVYNSLSEINQFPLEGTTKDYDNTSPELPGGLFNRIVVGADSAPGDIKPIRPGGFTDLTFNYSLSDLEALAFDLRDTGFQLRLESTGIYGGQTSGGNWCGTYGCKKDVYAAKVVPAAPTQTKACDGSLTWQSNYKVIEVLP